jgi:hypothetical protein
LKYDGFNESFLFVDHPFLNTNKFELLLEVLELLSKFALEFEDWRCSAGLPLVPEALRFPLAPLLGLRELLFNGFDEELT